MATLPTQSFSALVQYIAAGVQGRASALVDFTTGSVLRAISEAFAGALLWMQSIILQVATLTRAATSTAADLDSWMADFDLARVASVSASGNVTFSRFTAASNQPFIPVGAQVRTTDGTQTFSVIADTSNGAYSATLGGYTMGSGVGSLAVLVQADVGGSGGNVQPNTITQMLSPVTGIDTVTNASAFTNGADAETDAAFRSRFQQYILGLSRGDLYGLNYALASLQAGLQWVVVEDKDPGGATHYGFYYVVVDDGSGAPSSALLNAAGNAINLVRPLGVQYAVQGPTKVTADVGLTVTVASGYTAATVAAAVQAAITAGINGLGLGVGLPYSQIAGWAYAVPGVSSVSAVTLNAASGDAASISAVSTQTIKSGTITVATA